MSRRIWAGLQWWRLSCGVRLRNTSCCLRQEMRFSMWVSHLRFEVRVTPNKVMEVTVAVSWSSARMWRAGDGVLLKLWPAWSHTWQDWVSCGLWQPGCWCCPWLTAWQWVERGCGCWQLPPQLYHQHTSIWIGCPWPRRWPLPGILQDPLWCPAEHHRWWLTTPRSCCRSAHTAVCEIGSLPPQGRISRRTFMARSFCKAILMSTLSKALL